MKKGRVMACAGKVSYASFKQAERAIKSITRHTDHDKSKESGKMRPYQCPFCQQWHFGHQRKSHHGGPKRPPLTPIHLLPQELRPK